MTRLTRFPRVKFSYRVGLASAIVFALALGFRTLLFVSNFHAMHSANVIGWPFAADMFGLAMIGTVSGVCFSALAVYGKTSDGRRARWALFLNCLLLPLAFFLVFMLPHYFTGGVNFD